MLGGKREREREGERMRVWGGGEEGGGRKTYIKRKDTTVGAGRNAGSLTLTHTHGHIHINITVQLGRRSLSSSVKILPSG